MFLNRYTRSADLPGVRPGAFSGSDPCCDAIKSITESATYTTNSRWYQPGDRAPKGGGLSPRDMLLNHYTQSTALSGVGSGASPSHFARGQTPFPALTPVVMPSRAVRSHYIIETAIPALFAMPMKSGNEVFTFSQSSIIIADSERNAAIVNAMAIR